MSSWMIYVQTASWAGAALTAVIGVWRFGNDTKQARIQKQEEIDAKLEANAVARRELDWRRASAAQISLEKMESDPLASDAVLMLDWDGREFPSSKPAWRLRRSAVLHALRDIGEPFDDSEIYVRDAMDRLLWHFERIQQQIDVDLIDLRHVLFPLGYVAALMNEAPEPFQRFMTAYGYVGAMKLIESLKEQGLPDIDPDYEKLFGLDESASAGAENSASRDR
jgi:hypothetical protein